MGTLRRVLEDGPDPLAFHYWQAAERSASSVPFREDTPTKATDQRGWACDRSTAWFPSIPDPSRRRRALVPGRKRLPRRAAEGRSAGCIGTLAAPAAP